MPYDPDWDLRDGERVADINSTSAVSDYRNLSDVEESDGMGMDEGGEQYDSTEEQEDFMDSEDMEVDQLGPRGDQRSEGALDDTPKPRLPFPGAAAVAKLAQVEVVLYSSTSSPLKDALVPAGELPGDDGDDTNLVTSDIVPESRSKRHEESPTKAPAVSTSTTGVQPPVARTVSATATPQPKKRGRPFGWRKGFGSYSALKAGLPPGSLPPGSSTPRPKAKKPTSEQKPRRRPGRKPAPTARQLYLRLNPHFITFRCEWEGCPAELQNLETLRKHLLIVHGRPSASSSTTAAGPSSQTPSSHSPLTCKWSTCACPPLATREAFTAHLEKSHLAPFLWHVGDGPRSSTPSLAFSIHKDQDAGDKDKPLPSYLFDSRGNQVTPSIRDQQLENEDDRKKRQARLNRVVQQRDQNAPDEPEYTVEELKGMAEAMSGKRARQKMFRDYADRVCGGGMAEWRGLLA
ncbi:uncharacterized protein B0T15DRAFT_536114 [Chaetomium strumarium]|uniref:C2H2-type domain-containing protein n=1 Tax=Chaetomium strumarium TaxID=1170767 RepID=A0AAJ0GQK1_9PEZI|nr:hypothetical protein B0T15DRAFT_536114 [Chaetomium strumarium]